MADLSGWRWGPWIQWVLASSLGGGLMALVVRPASAWVGEVVSRTFGPVAAESAIGFLLVGGVVLGMAAGQWLVLRGQVDWAGSWLIASTAAGALGGAILLGLFATTEGDAGYAFSVIVGLLSFGALQTLLLDCPTPLALRFAAASVVGLMVAGPVTGLVGGLGFGAAYGAINGVAVLWEVSK